MRANLATSLRRRRTAPMGHYDSLPAELRHWLARAALPWSPASALRLWRQAMHRTGCPCAACACLDAAEVRLLVRDAAQIWGAGYPGQGHFDSIGRAG